MADDSLTGGGAGAPPSAIPQGASIGDPTPKAPTPPPTALPQGALVGDSGSTTPPDPAASSLMAPGSFLHNLNGGIAKGLDEGFNTAEGLLHKVPVVSGLLDKAGYQQQKTHDDAVAHSQTSGAGGFIGYAGENMAEFLLGDEALKGLSLPEKIAKVAPALKALEKSPALAARITRVALRQGAVGAGQSLLHGGTAGEAVTSGAITGASGGLLEGATSYARNLLNEIGPKSINIGGQDIPVLASQLEGASERAGKAATISETPAYQASQQEGGKQVVQHIAQTAYKNAIDRINVARSLPDAIQDESRLLPAPADMKPYQFRIAGPDATEDVVHGSSAPGREPAAVLVKSPNPNYRAPEELDSDAIEGLRRKLGFSGNVGRQLLPDEVFSGPKTTSGWSIQHFPPATGGGSVTSHLPGDLLTTDSTVAQHYVDRLRNFTDTPEFQKMDPKQQAGIQSSLGDVQKQLEGYRTYQQNFSPIDPAENVGGIKDFGDAVDHIEGAVKPVYQKMDQLSGGKFSEMRNQLRDARAVLRNPPTIKAAATARAAVDQAEDGIDQMFQQAHGQINEQDWRSANSAWRDARLLNRVSVAVDNPLSETAEEVNGLPGNKIAGEGQTDISGRQMNTGLRNLLKKTSSDDLDRVIGADGRQNLYRVSKLLTTPKNELVTKTFLKDVSSHVSGHYGVHGIGAVAGGLIGYHEDGEKGAFEGAALGGLAPAAGVGYRAILRKMATDPAFGKMMSTAIKSKVPAHLVAPFVSAAMQSVQHDN